LASIAIVVIGIAIGFLIESINNVVLWITGALWGGYTASNVLKWYWWRFNGQGYFWGMVAGIASALLIPLLDSFHLINFLRDWPLASNLGMNSFPVILIISIIGSIIATYLTPPESDETLIHFYKVVHPWGFWKPIQEKVLAANPKFHVNKDFKRDMINVLVGIIWQITLMAAPVFLVIREYISLSITLLVMMITSVFLKFNWWDKLGEAFGEKDENGVSISTIKVADSSGDVK
jgi:hypothetical protein